METKMTMESVRTRSIMASTLGFSPRPRDLNLIDLSGLDSPWNLADCGNTHDFGDVYAVANDRTFATRDRSSLRARST